MRDADQRAHGVVVVNVPGPLLVACALLPNLRNGRDVVANIGSRAGSMADGRDPDGDYAYECSIAALHMVTVRLADDIGLTALLSLLAKAGPEDSESFRAYDGTQMAW